MTQNFDSTLQFQLHAAVAELVDALALGASTARCGGSSPLRRTIIRIFSELSLRVATFSFVFLNSCQRQKPLSAPPSESGF